MDNLNELLTMSYIRDDVKNGDKTMLTKKHFKAIADIMKSLYSEGVFTHKNMMIELQAYFRDENPLFNLEKFEEACVCSCGDCFGCWSASTGSKSFLEYQTIQNKTFWDKMQEDDF